MEALCAARFKKSKQNKETHFHWHLLFFLHNVWKKKQGSGSLILQLDPYTPFCRKRNTTLPRHTWSTLSTLMSICGGLKLSMAPVPGALHSHTVTSAAVLSLFPQQGWLANKCIYLVSMWVVAPTMHTHPHTQSCRLKKTKACFAGMAVMQLKLKMKQGRDVKLKCTHCVCVCSSWFSSKSLQAL